MSIERLDKEGRRYYVVSEGEKEIGVFPSVTTILGETSDKTALEDWVERVGKEEADRISTLSMNRGTVMHRLIELYKLLKGSHKERLTELKEISLNDNEIVVFEKEFIDEGWKMFSKFYLNPHSSFDRIEEVLESETFLWSKLGYAGTVDNVSRIKDGRILVIDYKNSRKAKKEEWIEDYYLQLSAYYVAYWQRKRVKANGAEIWIANEEDNNPQIFELSEKEIQFYFSKFRERLSQYNSKFKKEQKY